MVWLGLMLTFGALNTVAAVPPTVIFRSFDQ